MNIIEKYKISFIENKIKMNGIYIPKKDTLLKDLKNRNDEETIYDVKIAKGQLGEYNLIVNDVTIITSRSYENIVNESVYEIIQIYKEKVRNE